ncbi:hypothetical protein ACFV5C_28075, partial [Streptomyces sp. NPDC059762]
VCARWARPGRGPRRAARGRGGPRRLRPLFLRLFVTREPVDGELADQAADAALAAVKAGVFTRRGGGGGAAGGPPPGHPRRRGAQAHVSEGAEADHT